MVGAACNEEKRGKWKKNPTTNKQNKISTQMISISTDFKQKKRRMILKYTMKFIVLIGLMIFTQSAQINLGKSHDN